MDKQKLIEDCKEEIQHLEYLISKPYSQRHPEHRQYLESQSARQKIALASLEAKTVGTVHIEFDFANHRNVATLDMRKDLVLADMKSGEALYTAPPAPVVKVPSEATRGDADVIDIGFLDGWNACRAEVLRLNDNSAPATDNTEAQYESLKRGISS